MAAARAGMAVSARRSADALGEAAQEDLGQELPAAGQVVFEQRDQHGVPHIEAASEDDLLFAQGYVTAQDRLWQMDSFRRNANGDLAEILGSSLVRRDTAQRVLQFRRTAERVYANLPEADRKRLAAYAAGLPVGAKPVRA